jgi:SAM-dependent methyltransferase
MSAHVARAVTIQPLERSVLTPIDYYTSAHRAESPSDAQIVAIELLRPALQKHDGRVLDLGCGDGFLLAEVDRIGDLSARGWELHGADYSPAVLADARRWPYTFEQCNLEEGAPYPDDTFDIVIASQLIEHLYDPDHLLREARRILRPGGQVLLTTPNLQAWYNRALFAAGIQPIFYETSTKSSYIGAGPLARVKRSPDPVGHVRVFNRRALLDLLVSEGFRPVELRGARFERIPATRLDRLFNRFPSLASNLVVLATRP